MNKKIITLLVLPVLILVFTGLLHAQEKQLTKRTTYKSEKIDFGVGGTVTIVGAPMGSINVEGWSKNEVEISAEIVVQAETEEDLAQLSKINGFVIDDTMGHIRILTVGTHDSEYMKRVAKKFPKKLLNLPFEINYTIKVPTYCDLEINAGKGDLKLANVEGAMQIKATESNATLNLIGGTISAVFGSGNVDVKIGTRSWRGRQAVVQLAAGTLNVQFPNNMNAEVDAAVLRNGQIENSLTALKPREKTKFSEKTMLARLGNGGALLSFTVGDGTLKMSNW
jgi:hypothetical protein